MQKQQQEIKIVSSWMLVEVLHLSLLLIELSQEIAVLHASVSFPILYLKDLELILITSIICVNYRESFDLE